MRAKYSQQFKEEAVALALESDCLYSQIAKDLDVNYQTFGNWVRAAMSKSNGIHYRTRETKKPLSC